MNGTAVLKAQLDMSRQWLMALLADVEGAEVTAPTPNGGNHPLWALGHIIHSEAGILNGFVLGRPSPLARWDRLFGKGSRPVNDISVYPSLTELLAEFDRVRGETLNVLSEMSESDLDRPSKAPTHLSSLFGTIGQCFAIIGLHACFHAGQIADARRAAGKKPVFDSQN